MVDTSRAVAEQKVDRVRRWGIAEFCGQATLYPSTPQGFSFLHFTVGGRLIA